MAKKEQAIQQPIELDASKSVATLKDLQKLVNDLNKSLRVTANIMKDVGGSHSVALAGALSPSRDMAGTNAAVKGFVQGTEAMTALERRKAEGLTARAAFAQQQAASTVAARNDDMARFGTTRFSAIMQQKAQARAQQYADSKKSVELRQGERASVQQAQENTQARWQERAAFTQGAPMRVRDLGRARQDVAETRHIQETLNYDEATGFREDREKRLQSARTQGVMNRAAVTESQRLKRESDKDAAETRRKAKVSDQQAARLQATEEKAKRVDLDLKNRGGSTIDVIERRGAIQEGLIKLRASLKGTGTGRRGGLPGVAGVEGDGPSATQMLGMLPGGGMATRFSSMMSPGSENLFQRMNDWGSSSISKYHMRGPPPPGSAPGTLGPLVTGGRSLGGMVGAGAGVLAGGAALAGGALIGGVHMAAGKMQGTYGAALGSMMGMEQTFRRTAQAGGGAHVMDSLRAAGGSALRSQFGMTDEAIAGASVSFLDARGMSTASADQGHFLRTGEHLMGGDHTVGGRASALGYSAGRYDASVRAGRQSGLAGAALRAGVGAQLSAEERAAGYGIHGSGIVENNMQFSQQLSRGGFGGRAFGGIAAVNKLQGAGAAPMDSIRGSVRTIADTLVMIEAFKKGGSLPGALDAEAGMNAEDRFNAIRKGGSVSAIALQGLGFSAAQAAGRGDRFMPALDDMQGYNVARSRAASVADHGVLEAGVSGGMLESVQKLEIATKELNVSMTQSIAVIKGLTDTLSDAKNNAPGILGFTLAALP